MYYIYTLIDPRDGEARYVGMSCNPELRLRGHIYGKENSSKGSWITGLREERLMPLMNIVDLMPTIRQARQREAILMIELLDQGSRITNRDIRCPMIRRTRYGYEWVRPEEI